MSKANKLKGHRKYFLGILRELEVECEKRPAWIFLCCSALIEFLAKTTVDPAVAKPPDWKTYIDFIEKYMPSSYTDFKYLNANASMDSAGNAMTTKTDLLIQMYCVLRCGLVHSFSMTPNPKYTTSKPGKYGRKRSIVLSHKRKGKRGGKHLGNYKGKDGTLDAARFVLQDFIVDIRKALKKLFKAAMATSTLGEHILANLATCPPLQEV